MHSTTTTTTTTTTKMVKLTPEELAVQHRATSKLRNVCVIAHVDHGKSTLTDSLSVGAGLLAAKDVGRARKTDTREDEAARAITIKSTGISLYLDVATCPTLKGIASLDDAVKRDVAAAAKHKTRDEQGFLINLIDCPGHVDFSSEVTAALRLCDGALVVVDCIGGAAVQTRTVLRQSLTERVRPVLAINKLDRALGETQDSPEELYERCRAAIADVNDMIGAFQDARRDARRHAAEEAAEAAAAEGDDDGDAAAASAASASAAADGEEGEVWDEDWRVSPARGEVSFCVALHGWGFTVPQFAAMLIRKGGLAGVEGAETVESLSERLWGDWYLDKKGRKFVQQSVSPSSGRKLKRAFCEFIVEPIMAVRRACGLEGGRSDGGASAASAAAVRPTWDSVAKMLTAVGALEERWPKGAEARQALIDGPAKELHRVVMQAWLPGHEALLSTVVAHLPSPLTAMKYRCEQLYTGPRDSATAKAIRECDPDGPLCVFISKHVPTKDNKRFISFGRVFSGTIRSGEKVTILAPQYDGAEHRGTMASVVGAEEAIAALTAAGQTVGKPKDLMDNIAVQRTVVMMADRTEPADAVPCGNTVGMFGIDAHVNKTCTLVDAGAAKAAGGGPRPAVWPLAPLRYTVAPVVRVAVRPKNPAHVGKLAAALGKLTVSDPLVQVHQDRVTHEYTIACAGELHLEICLGDLTGMFLTEDVELVVGDPAVPHQETVTQNSAEDFGGPCLAKSANKHNRFWVTAEPLPDALVDLLDSGAAGGDALRAGLAHPDAVPPPTAEAAVKARAQRLHREFGLDLNEMRRVWAFGPEAMDGPAEVSRGGSGAMTCMFVDCTKGVAYLHEARDTLIGAFHEVSAAGALAGEPLRGVLFKLHDAQLHADSPHRSPSQVVPALKRCLQAAQLAAHPKLVEPVFLADITCTSPESVGRIYTLLASKRGAAVTEEIPAQAGAMAAIHADLPVSESFGFAAELRGATQGEAFPQLSFDHWATLDTLAFAPTPSKTAADPDALAMIEAIRKRKGMTQLQPQLVANLVDRL